MMDRVRSSSLRIVWAALVVAALVAVGCVACRSTLDSGGRSPQPSASSSTTAPTSPTSHSAVVVPPPAGDYADAVRAAVRHGLQVWLEADLVKRWLAGPSSFDAALVQLGSLATIKGVDGIKIADELGYHDGLTSAAQVRGFLSASSSGLARYAPGKPLLIDMIVPSLGCLPDVSPPLIWSTECMVKSDGQYPQLSLASITGYLQMHAVSVLDLSTGLLPDSTYVGWGVTRDTVQTTAWAKVASLGWRSLVVLHARKALAHPGAYTESVQQTQADLTTWVDLPLRDGAQAVDVWTWRQLYQGDINRLLDPGLQSNALWAGLRAERARGDALFTHFSPHSLEVSLDTDLTMMATVFTAVFVAAGTG